LTRELGPDESAQQRANAEVSSYYDAVQWVYNLGSAVYNLGSRRKAHSVHYGVWLEDTRSMVDALLNVDILAAEGLELREDDVLLDAGCGVGGSSVYFASNYGCRVVGITVSDVQLRQARKNAKKAGVEHLATFMKMDYTQTSFEDGHFTKVVGIESICYAVRKVRFAQEAFRVLREGGKLVVTDAFLQREPSSVREERDLASWYDGWKVPSLVTSSRFREYLDSAGFTVTRYADLTGGTIPTAKVIYNMHLPLYPLGLLLSRVSPSSETLLGHVKASLRQIDLGPHNKNGIIGYWMFVSEKRPAGGGGPTEARAVPVS
jgi:tocopherol O-methyltransferase